MTLRKEVKNWLEGLKSSGKITKYRIIRVGDIADGEVEVSVKVLFPNPIEYINVVIK